MTTQVLMAAAFKRALDQAGTQEALAKIMGCTQGNVAQLLARKSSCPPASVLKVEAATGVSRHDLRPDLYPRDPAPAAPPAADRGLGEMEPVR